MAKEKKLPIHKLEVYKKKITKEQWEELSDLKKMVWAQSISPNDGLDVALYWVSCGNYPSIEEMASFVGYRYWVGVQTKTLSKMCDSAWEKTVELLQKIEDEF